MSENAEGVVRRVDEVFTEEALASQDGKTVPLTDRPGGRVIGSATFKYDAGEKALKAELKVDDPNLAEFLKGPPPSIF
jgi:hypothetical protein